MQSAIDVIALKTLRQPGCRQAGGVHHHRSHQLGAIGHLQNNAIGSAICRLHRRIERHRAASVFKVATSAAVTTWDPIQSFSTEAFYMTNIYEPLLWKNPDGVSPEYSPALATSWSSSKDGKTWTFKLRQGATFHDGSPVTPDAVKQSFEISKKIGATTRSPETMMEIVSAALEENPAVYMRLFGWKYDRAEISAEGGATKTAPATRSSHRPTRGWRWIHCPMAPEK